MLAPEIGLFDSSSKTPLTVACCAIRTLVEIKKRSKKGRVFVFKSNLSFISEKYCFKCTAISYIIYNN